MKHELPLLIVLGAVSLTAILAQTGVDFQTCGPRAIPPDKLTRIIEGWRSEGCTEVHLRFDAQSGKWLGYGARIEKTVMPSNLEVTGAGDATLNAVYTRRGSISGKDYYTKVGSPDPSGGDFSDSIWWNINEWNFMGPGNSLYWLSGEAVAFPWQVVTWDPDSGSAPPPTITEVPAITPSKILKPNNLRPAIFSPGIAR